MGTTKSLGPAQVKFDDRDLLVDTGLLARTWRWTGYGFTTVGLSVGAVSAGRVAWPITGETSPSDWSLPYAARQIGGGLPPAVPDPDEYPTAELVSMSVDTSTDDGFTSEHVRVRAEIAYESVRVLFEVWVYPESPGIRTQLRVRAEAGYHADETRFTGPIEGLPALVDRETRRRAFGYFNDTQNRNDTATDILKEEELHHPLSGREWCRWASAFCLERGTAAESTSTAERARPPAEHGIALVKESHKCPNQRGHDTGMFLAEPNRGLVSLGWGLLPAELRADRFRDAWAHWTVGWLGGDLERETAFKSFDAIRYPIDPSRDIYTIANTWGSSWNKTSAQGAAAESGVRQSLPRESKTCLAP